MASPWGCAWLGPVGGPAVGMGRIPEEAAPSDDPVMLPPFEVGGPVALSEPPAPAGCEAHAATVSSRPNVTPVRSVRIMFLGLRDESGGSHRHGWNTVRGCQAEARHPPSVASLATSLSADEVAHRPVEAGDLVAVVRRPH